jgi:hypothetical protein
MVEMEDEMCHDVPQMQMQQGEVVAPQKPGKCKEQQKQEVQ